jgi:uncharacterized RDD family membrane protein YckC
VDRGECPRCGTLVAFYRDTPRTGVEPPPAPVVAPGARPGQPGVSRPAGFWIRALAVFLDGLFLIAVGFIQGVLTRAVFGEAVEDSPVLRGANRAFEVVFGGLYTILFHWLWGQTFGKMAVRIRVVMMDGEPLSLPIAALRYLGAIASAVIFGIGYVMAGVRADKRALHDLIAGTRVEHTE